MFYKSNRDGYKEILPGIKLKTLVFGDKSLLSEFRMEQGSQLPSHTHSQEQAAHRAEILADSVAIEVFSPVREDYLPQNLA